MPRSLPFAVAVVASVLLLTGFMTAGPSAKLQRLAATDRALCPFPLQVKVTRSVRPGAKGRSWSGQTAVVLRNADTGARAMLEASGSRIQEARTGSIWFQGPQLWLSPETHVPYLSSAGKGSRRAPTFVVAGAVKSRDVIDPCALVAPLPPTTHPRETAAPWPPAAFALSQIARAGLVPLIGKPTRHDHMHLDVIVNGRRVTVPGGIGQAGPVDRGPGPCPPPPESRTIGDCAPGHYFTAAVAAAQLQTHTSSGILHLQSERRGERLTLGQFFDAWGVRFDTRCLGVYCTGDGKELRVYVAGGRLRGDPRKLVLRDRQQIAVVFGTPGDFAAVPATYGKRWPFGCGGPGERSCFPG